MGRAGKFYRQADHWVLEALPGVGETKAQAIVDHRNDNGPFKGIGDLLQVRGIDEVRFDKTKY